MKKSIILIISCFLVVTVNPAKAQNLKTLTCRTLNVGWNWIGLPLQTIVPIEEALAAINPVDGDYIKSQHFSATYYDGIGWWGDLTELAPLEGYKLYISHPETLCIPFADPEGSFEDIRDGHTYGWVQIGDQTWMAENLAWLPEVYPSSNTSGTETRYYVYEYEGTSAAFAKTLDHYIIYGVLYNWTAAKTACPDGWHLPSELEWRELETSLGMHWDELDDYGARRTGLVGKKIKSASRWENDGNGNNASGFNALPSGYMSNNDFYNIGRITTFWSSTRWDEDYTENWMRSLQWNENAVMRYFDSWDDAYPIRCVKNN